MGDEDQWLDDVMQAEEALMNKENVNSLLVSNCEVVGITSSEPTKVLPEPESISTEPSTAVKKKKNSKPKQISSPGSELTSNCEITEVASSKPTKMLTEPARSSIEPNVGVKKKKNSKPKQISSPGSELTSNCEITEVASSEPTKVLPEPESISTEPSTGVKKKKNIKPKQVASPGSELTSNCEIAEVASSKSTKVLPEPASISTEPSTVVKKNKNSKPKQISSPGSESTSNCEIAEVASSKPTKVLTEPARSSIEPNVGVKKKKNSKPKQISSPGSELTSNCEIAEVASSKPTKVLTEPASSSIEPNAGVKKESSSKNQVSSPGSEENRKRKPEIDSSKCSKSKKKSKVGTNEAKEMVLMYMKEQSRPHNSTKVYENLNKIVGHAEIQKVLVVLSDEGNLTVKTEGKSSLYWTVQASEDMSALQNAMELLTATKADLRSTLDTLNLQVHQGESAKRSVAMEPTDTDLLLRLVELKSLVSSLSDSSNEIEGKLLMLKVREQETEGVRDTDALQCEFKFFKRCWNENKRNVNRVLESVIDGCGETKESLIEVIGLIMDEEII